jgi:hypothetical protein
VVDQFKFRKETPLNKSCGKVHDYVGMTLNFFKPGEVTVTMLIDQIKGILHDTPKEMHGLAATPAANHLFQINQVNPTPLEKDKAKIYVHIIIELLYLSQFPRPTFMILLYHSCAGGSQSPTNMITRSSLGY